MKLLRLLTMRQHTGGRAALLGGIVLWLSGSLASPAHATSMAYDIVGPGNFTGSFSFDNTTSKFTDWNIIAHFSLLLGGDVTFNPAFQIPPDVNSGGQLSQIQGPVNIQFSIPNPAPGNGLFVAFGTTTNNIFVMSQVGDFVLHPNSAVPEPAAAVLLATSLLALAGSRWLPGRRDRPQLG